MLFDEWSWRMLSIRGIVIREVVSACQKVSIDC